MVGDADLLNSVLSDTDIVISDVELINFSWLADLNQGVKPRVFIAVQGREGQPKLGCLHTLSVSQLKAILTQIEANIEAKKKRNGR